MRALWVCTTLAILALAPALRAEAPKKAEGKVSEIPYRLTATQHILVRAKINGKGPFNFIVDTGAPALFVSTAICRKLGIEPDKKGWGTFDRFEIEGGAVIEKARGRIEDPFQLEGMNGLGLAGAELHGVIGYNVLARFKLEFDFTKTKMTWARLDFDPPAPQGLGGAGQGGVDAMAMMVKVALALIGKRPQPEITERGFLGVELVQGKEGITVKAVLARGPAAMAGIQAGDRITRLQGSPVKTLADVHKQALKVAAGESAKVSIERKGEKQEIVVKSGEGL